MSGKLADQLERKAAAARRQSAARDAAVERAKDRVREMDRHRSRRQSISRTGKAKKYLGKSAEAVTIHRSGGTSTAGTWLTREHPLDISDGVSVQQRFALTYATIQAGDEVTDSAGQRWVAIEVQSSASGEQHAIFDVRLGAVEP